jgi:Asp-tRNA(Asn)/Glu-tRNA(Gln) amidotransferase A subunit family amidase
MSQPPTAEDVQAYADDVGLMVGEEAAALAEQFAAQDDLLEPLERFADGDPPARRYWSPDEDDDPYGAFLTRCDIGDGDGPLDGMRVAIKDNVAVAGVPMTCGAPLLEEYVPPADATVVERLLDAGGRIVGKANMDEFAFGGSRDTMRFRLARNPNAPDRQPGSSSAGSGVAVTTGDADVAVGSDTGGSIRFPAAWCGVVGLKPTRGLVSHHGFVQYAKTLDNVGLLASETDQIAEALQAIAGTDRRDERTRTATVGDYAAAVEQGHTADPSDLTIGKITDMDGNAPDLDAVTDAALDELADAGATVREVSIPDYEVWLPAWLGLAMTEIGSYLDSRASTQWTLATGDPALSVALHDRLPDQSDELGSTVVSAWLYRQHLQKRYGDRYYALAHRARQALTDGVDEALDGIDVLASTTVPMLPPTWDEAVEDVFGALANTGPFNVSGHPAVSVPAGTVDGLPVGIQFVGATFDEASVLRTAAHWESINES